MKSFKNMLKRSSLIAACAALSLASNALANGYSAVVTNVSVPVCAAAGTMGGVAWTSNTVYAVGAVVWNTGKGYLCVGAGTSTNAAVLAPVGSAGVDFLDGTVTWRPALMRPRRGLVVVNASTNLFMFVNDCGAANVGARVNPNGGSFSVDGLACPQGPVYINMSGTTSTTNFIWEW